MHRSPGTADSAYLPICSLDNGGWVGQCALYGTGRSRQQVGLGWPHEQTVDLMADRKRAHRMSPRAIGVAYLIAFVGLTVVMVRVPGGLSGVERIGLWAFSCGTTSILVFLKMLKQD